LLYCFFIASIYACQCSPIEFKNDKTVSGEITHFQSKFDDSETVEPSLGLDLIDRISERRRNKTIEEGVPYPLVDVSVLLPDTLMNLSGTAARKFVDKNKFRLKKNPDALNRGDELVVVVDDIALPLGTCRWKSRGSHGGQNGIRDIIKRLGTERFARLRVGVGPADGGPISGDVAKYVLGDFNAIEQDQLKGVLQTASEYLRVYLHRGVAAASQIANNQKKKGKDKSARSDSHGTRRSPGPEAKRQRRE
jgi:PTH1 family peptidyl-tRNA hydrolase